MLVNRCYLKDIREYEESSGKNILRLFDKVTIDNIVKLLNIFNGQRDTEYYCTLIDNYIEEENKSILDIYNEIKQVFLGDDIQQNKHNDNNDSDDVYEDITTYRFMTDFYMKLCMQIMSLGVTYSEFWSFTTKEMYTVFYGIQQKIILDYNKQMQIAHSQAGLIGAAVWGKLPNKAPQIGDITDEDRFDDDEIIDTPMGKMTRGNYNLYLALEKEDMKIAGGKNNG